MLVFLRNYKRRWVARRLIDRYGGQFGGQFEGQFEGKFEGQGQEMTHVTDKRVLLPQSVPCEDERERE